MKHSRKELESKGWRYVCEYGFGSEVYTNKSEDILLIDRETRETIVFVAGKNENK